MGKMKINFSEVSGGFDPLPEEAFEAIIERVEVRDSKSSDDDYLNWEFKITDDEYEDRRLWNITSLSEKALFRLKDDFVTLGVLEEDEDMEIEWEEDIDITPSEGPRLTHPDVEGMACIVVVKNEVYEGKERSKVAEVRAADGAKPKSKAKANGGRKAAGKASTGSRRKLR